MKNTIERFTFAGDLTHKAEAYLESGMSVLIFIPRLARPISLTYLEDWLNNNRSQYKELQVVEEGDSFKGKRVDAVLTFKVNLSEGTNEILLSRLRREEPPKKEKGLFLLKIENQVTHLENKTDFIVTEKPYIFKEKLFFKLQDGTLLMRELRSMKTYTTYKLPQSGETLIRKLVISKPVYTSISEDTAYEVKGQVTLTGGVLEFYTTEDEHIKWRLRCGETWKVEPLEEKVL